MVPYLFPQESAWYTVNLEAINSSVIRDKFVQLEKGNDFSLLYRSRLGFSPFTWLQKNFYLCIWYYVITFHRENLSSALRSKTFYT